MNKLTRDEVKERLAGLKGWKVRGVCLEKDFEFVDFRAAMAFMGRLVSTAEELNHHPDWSNSYNKIHVSLTSHDVGGLTANDFAFAEAADKVADGAQLQ